jgi:hypothetical protein
MHDTIETRRDRAVLAQDAGLPKVSFLSVLAGTLVAYGAFAVLVAISAAVARAAGFEANLSGDEWRRLGVGGGAAVAVVLFLSYLFGGYVAGRMARRAGALNGFLVFVLGVVLAVGVAGMVELFTDGDDILNELRGVGIPTTTDEWRNIGTVAGIGSLLGILLGSLLGGGMGERWHGKLLTRAMDPTVGAGTPTTAHATTGQAVVVDDGRSIMDRSDGERREEHTTH